MKNVQTDRMNHLAKARWNRVMDRGVGPWSFDAFRFHAGPLSLESANRYCRNMARGHYENFPVVMSLFTTEVQEGLAAVYAFARTADDFADEPQFGSNREVLLDQWEDQLEACFRGEASHPVFIALRDAIARFKLDKKPFHDLLEAFHQDCRTNRYRTIEDLTDYCRRSANPVGRIVLKILGDDRDVCRAWSDDICTALQLTNFWQDVSVDLRRDRLYIPLEDLDRFRVGEKTLQDGPPPSAFCDLMRFEIDRTRGLFRRGRPLLASTGYPERLYFAGIWLGGRTVLRMVSDLNDRILRERPRLRIGALAMVWFKAVPRKLAAYPGGIEWTH